MGRSRRSPAQKAALARASQIALERHRNKLGFPSASTPLSGSSHPQALPNSIDQGNISQSKQDRTELAVDNNSESVRSAAKRALKREELKLARERERVAALERKLQDARRRESELQEEVKALQKECRLGE